MTRGVTIGYPTPMLDHIFRVRRRRAILAGPFPEEWREHLRGAIPYDDLTGEERSRIEDLVRIFVAEKRFEGCEELEIDDEKRLTIAAMACYMALGLDDDVYNGVETILLYPESYLVPEEDEQTGRAIPGTEEERSGEAAYHGPVVLSWEDIVEDIENAGDGTAVVYHEFAHEIDMLDGAIDGTPPLGSDDLRRRWGEAFGRALEELREAANLDEETFLDPYGAEDEAEFFAVAVEAFFSAPADFQEEHPDLYLLLREYFGQDPAGRSGPGDDPEIGS